MALNTSTMPPCSGLKKQKADASIIKAIKPTAAPSAIVRDRGNEWKSGRKWNFERRKQRAGDSRHPRVSSKAEKATRAKGKRHHLRSNCATCVTVLHKEPSRVNFIRFWATQNGLQMLDNVSKPNLSRRHLCLLSVSTSSPVWSWTGEDKVSVCDKVTVTLPAWLCSIVVTFMHTGELLQTGTSSNIRPKLYLCQHAPS